MIKISKDCGECPMSWETRSCGETYECADCGCAFSGRDFNTPTWKCMLPNFIKRKIMKKLEEQEQKAFEEWIKESNEEWEKMVANKNED